jgi:hypothetical protein
MTGYPESAGINRHVVGDERALQETRANGNKVMSIASGTKLGPYEITGAIGAGGMGEVYRARDPKLGRMLLSRSCPKLLPVMPSA